MNRHEEVYTFVLDMVVAVQSYWASYETTAQWDISRNHKVMKSWLDECVRGLPFRQKFKQQNLR